MEADGLPMEEAGNTEQLQEYARQRFLDFLESFVVNDDEDSRSQFTQGSQQSAPTPPSKLYVEQVHLWALPDFWEMCTDVPCQCCDVPVVPSNYHSRRPVFAATPRSNRCKCPSCCVVVGFTIFTAEYDFHPYGTFTICNPYFGISAPILALTCLQADINTTTKRSLLTRPRPGIF